MDSLNTTTTATVALLTTTTATAGPSTALSSVMTRASDVVVAHGSSSWIGLVARLILWTLQLLSTIIYFALKLTTFSIPSVLFSIFSTSLTFTMNATTLYVLPRPTLLGNCPLTCIKHAHLGPDLLGRYVGGSLPIFEHVFETSTRTPEEGTRCRYLP